MITRKFYNNCPCICNYPRYWNQIDKQLPSICGNIDTVGSPCNTFQYSTMLDIAPQRWMWHYGDVLMSAMASQIISLTIVYSIVYTGAVNENMSLVFVRGIHQWPVSSPHQRPVTRKMFPFDDVIIGTCIWECFTKPGELRKSFFVVHDFCGWNQHLLPKGIHWATH